MNEFGNILLDAVVDTAKLLPFLLAVYFLIELLEWKNVFKFENSKLLKGNASPVIGALFGSVPQCGFSVISSELYAEKKISVAALLAVFIATSDEAFPIMISNIKSIPALLVLILIKFIVAMLVGYLALLIVKLFEKRAKVQKASEKNAKSLSKHEKTEKILTKEHENEHHEHLHACCNHDIDSQKFNWKHPLIHTIKIAVFIFLINLVMNGIVEIVGSENIVSFLSGNRNLQPLFALVVGLIPNCVSSVLLTNLYLGIGTAGVGISFGALVTGLCVNAGIGLLLLFKNNKNLKENIFILLMLIIPSLLIGYGLHFLPINLLG